MDIGLLPSRFLSVVLEESDRKSSIINKNFQIPKVSFKSITISPVIPNLTLLQEKKQNGKVVHPAVKFEPEKFNSGFSRSLEYFNLKKRLPRTVLEECTVELSSLQKPYDEISENVKDAIIIKPAFSEKKEKLLSFRENYSNDFPNFFNQVEVVYSDDDESANLKKVNDISLVELAASYACGHCPNKYTNKGALWQHNVAAHSAEKTCECQLCGRKFYRNCSLALHMKCHSDEQSCSCKICGKEFNRLSILDRHVKCHNIESPIITLAFSCKICNKKCNDETSLRMHILSHNQKYTCDQCNVTFSTRQLLDLHFHITHRRSKTPFACKLCKARFANLRELNEHSASHTFEKSRISCHHCGEIFNQRCTYKKHLQLHVGERLSCNICRIDFTQRSSLLRHYKRLHMMNDIPDASNLTITAK